MREYRWVQLKNFNFYLMIFGDIILFSIAHVFSYLLRFEFTISPSNWKLISRVIPILIPLKLIVFYVFGLYKGMWRYTSLKDMQRLFQATVTSTVVLISILVFSHRFEGYSRSVFLLDMLLTFLLTGSYRIGIRYTYMITKGESFWNSIKEFKINKINSNNKYKPILIIGAGSAGEKLLREIYDNPHLEYRVVGFLDDDPNKLGRSLHGVTILGKIKDLSIVLERYDIKEVFIAIPSATGAQMRSIVNSCEKCAISYKTLPGIGEIVEGKVTIKSLRPVRYEDLLGRPPVKLDIHQIADYLKNRKVLVTGCGGSIGSELCRQIVRFEPKEIILMDASEENLYRIQMELHHEKNFFRYHTILGKVQHRSLVESMFKEYTPEVVFHAAAYKHVPMIEKNPWEAVFNNIIGSKVVMEESIKYGVKRFVLVSTDKAVRPTNVMGVSKRIAELILQSLQGNGTRFMAVRFGNVIGSSGSVVPLFLSQIEHGGPVTVTHPEVVRYFMSIQEAAQLILQAGALGKGGEIFVLEMGEPIKILNMAEDLIKLSGKEPYKDIEIVFTGLREGEKLYEELITEGEDIISTSHKKILMLRPNGFFKEYEAAKEFTNWLSDKLDSLVKVAALFDSTQIKEKLKEIIPEYKPYNK